MKNIVNRIICLIIKRHTKEQLKKHGGRFHQFYNQQDGVGGIRCICPKCGYHKIFTRYDK